MFSDEFFSGLEEGMLKKQSFVGGMLSSTAKGTWKALKFPFSGFKNPALKHLDEAQTFLPGVKGFGAKTMAGAGLFGGIAATPGIASEIGRASQSAYKTQKIRKNLVSPVTKTSPQNWF